MSFLYPLFLLASLALAIPILVHLFNFRKFKTIAFPDIRFLKTIQQQTQKSARLKHLLILLSRLLLLAGLILAFAQPYFTKQGAPQQGGSTIYSFFVDNSYSMGLPHAQGTLLDVARAKVRDVIESADEQARFHILTHDFGDKEHRFLNKQEALEKLGSLRTSPYNRPAETILAKQAQMLQQEGAARKLRIYISDFQQGSFPLQTKSNDALETLMLQLNAQNTQNLVIDTVLVDAPGVHRNQEVPLRVRLRNTGETERETQLTLALGDQLKSMNTLTVKPGEVQETVLKFTPSGAGNHAVKVFLQDYPVSFDDTFYLSMPVSADRQVLLLNQSNANAYLNAVFKTGDQFRVDNLLANSVSPSMLGNYALIVLNGTTSLSEQVQQALVQHVERGGQLFIFPPAQGEPGDLNRFLENTVGVQWGSVDTQSASVSSFNRAHPLFKNVFDKVPENTSFPMAKKRRPLAMSAMHRLQSLMSLSNGDMFLGVGQVGSGQVFISTVAPETSWSDFPTSYWFLPLLHQMAFWQSAEVPAAITIGSRTPLSIQNKRLADRPVYHAYGRGIDLIPEQQARGNRVNVFFQQGVRDAGWYGMALPETTDTTFTGLNYDRVESDLRFWTLNDLKKVSGMKQVRWLTESLDLRHEVNPMQAGMPLWKVCLILALIGLLAEVLLIRLMR